jgi:hypothetical protein
MRIPKKETRPRSNTKTKARAAKQSRNGRGGKQQRRNKNRFFVSPGDIAEADLNKMRIDAASDAVADVQPPPSIEAENAWQQALQLWLNWNEAYEQEMACLFKSGQPMQRVEYSMDQLDDARQEAVRLSETIIRQ